METGTQWEIPTLEHFLNNGGSVNLRVKVIEKAITEPDPNNPEGEIVISPAVVQYACDGCGVFCWPFELVDASPWDGVPNDWACGGCRDKMKYTLQNIDNGTAPQSPIDVHKKMLETHGAPPEVVEKSGETQLGKPNK